MDVSDFDELNAAIIKSVNDENKRNLNEFVQAIRELRTKIHDSLILPEEEWLEDHGIVGWSKEDDNGSTTGD